jgi:hypothetical protein
VTACSPTSNAAHRRHVRRCWPATTLYVAAILLASWLIPDGAHASPLTVAIALLPGLGIVGMIWAMARLLIELDDEFLTFLVHSGCRAFCWLDISLSGSWYTDLRAASVLLKLGAASAIVQHTLRRDAELFWNARLVAFSAYTAAIGLMFVFFAEYSENWIKRLRFDVNGNVDGVFNFEPPDGSADGPTGDIVALTEGPDGALYYVDLG